MVLAAKNEKRTAWLEKEEHAEGKQQHKQKIGWVWIQKSES